MRTAALIRPPKGTNDDQGIFGLWVSDSGYKCQTLELPWRDNAPMISCVPLGSYLCRWMWSEKHGRSLYHLLNVPMRDVIEIHAANWAGDTSLGFISQLRGCISPGKSSAIFDAKNIPGASQAQKGVINSGQALAELEKDMLVNCSQVDFNLTIQEYSQ